MSKKVNHDSHMHKHGKNGFLLASLVALIVLFPFLEGGVIRYAILNLLVSIVLLSGVYAESYDRRHFTWALILGIPALLMSWATITTISPTIQFLSIVTAIPFYLFTIITLFLAILRSDQVTINEIYGAISVYLLIGIVWAYLYNLVQKLVPGSFFYSGFDSVNHIINGSDLLYFSFITLTTLGYGEITPITNYARSLVVLEVVIGVFFIAILISRLVNSYRAK